MKKAIILTVAVLALILVATTAFAAEDTQWKLTGTAYYSDTEDGYVLTEDVQQVNGGIWLEDFFYNNFMLEFDYYTGINPSGPNGVTGYDPTGADGIRVSFFLPAGYTLSDTAEFTEEGGSMGYFGPGFSVELDTFCNDYDTVKANHIALTKDSNENHLVVTALPEAEDGEWHHIKIIIDGDTCSVYVDENDKITYTGIKSTACGLLGITAATGDDTNRHAVKNIYYKGSVEPVPVTTPGPAPVTAPSANLIAKPTASVVLVNGQQVAFDAYNIEGSNYFKLRDLANVLNGSAKQFEVGWDGAANAISLTSGQPYTSVGGEMQAGAAGEQTPAVTTAKILLDGKEVNLTAYNIGGNNYFKLRDVGLTFDFAVEWDSVTSTIVIDTGKGYTAE